jgi:hypothetical protein
MPDYDLEKLHTRSFEQLIQAFCLVVLGNQSVIFGDGADGGREATFDGPINYPDSVNCWSGYGIVQAKFRQKPHAEPKVNADWVIEQLKAEFKNLKRKGKNPKVPNPVLRICPDYYIFATNISLSSVAGTGGKDRVEKTLKSYQKSHGLKGYAIWDRDQIARFLDVHSGIRTTYSAWLQPGDVLAEMLTSLGLESSDFQTTIYKYLESELLDDQFARLGQGGYTEAKNIPLSTVFMDVPVEWTNEAKVNTEVEPQIHTFDFPAPKQNPLTFLQAFFAEGQNVLRPSIVSQHSVKSRKILSFGRLVLIGGPGQGKTTVGQFACQLLRVSLLKATGRIFSTEVSRAIELIEFNSGELPAMKARRYPLRVDLKQLARALADSGTDHAKSVLDFLVKRIGDRTDTTVHREHFRKWLAAYPWVLVLDGLDEVPSSSNRKQVMDAIRDFISVEAHGLDADLLVLATTRPQGYSDEFDPTLYRHLILNPLNAEQALQYGSQLANARHPGQTIRVGELFTSLQRATTNPATVRLMQSPLQVTIMLALIEGGGEPPELRWKLFRDYYDVIYRREKERGTAFSEILKKYESDVHWIHHRIGWVLQQRNATSGGTDAQLSHSEFEQIVDQRLLNRGHNVPEDRQILVKSIRHAATDRLVFLVGNTETQIGFEIRSLQEFMTAEHFFDGGETYVRTNLKAIAPFPYWQNVFLFAAGKIFFERQELIDCILSICARLNEHADPALNATFAGSRLASSILKDGAARNQPSDVRVLARCASQALDSYCDDSALALADLFYGETEGILREELVRRLTSTNPTFPYHIWRLCLSLISEEITWAETVFCDHFPWSDPSVEIFMFRYCGTRNIFPDVFWLRVAQNIYQINPYCFRVLFQSGSGVSELPEFLKTIFLGVFLPDNQTLWTAGRSDKNSTLEFAVYDLQANNTWEKFEYPHFDEAIAHSSWKVWFLVTEFAKNLSILNLVLQLTRLAKIDFATSLPEFGCLPWQISTCISAHKEGFPWEEIVASVEAGSLGNQVDWQRWSNENREFLNISKIRFSNHLNVTDELQGAMLEPAGFRATREEGLFETFVETVASCTSSENDLRVPMILPRLYRYAVMRLMDSHSKYEDQRMVFVDTIRCLVHNQRNLDSSSLLTMLFLVKESETMFDLLAELAIYPTGRQWVWGNFAASHIDEALAALIQSLVPSQRTWLVMSALSILPPSFAFRDLPQELIRKFQQNPAHFQAATKLKINRMQWSDLEAIELVRDAINLDDRVDTLEDFIEFIDSRDLTGTHFEAFLVELTKKLPKADPPGLLHAANSLLIKLLDRRPPVSSLPDTTIQIGVKSA